jgi:Uma2 family endonuclease
MAEAGILRPDAHVELIEGEIIDMAPIGSRHAGVVEQLASILRAAAGDSAMVRTQQPVSLGDRSEPEPDLAVVRARSDFYKLAHPGPADVFLLIEVAEASLQYDTTIKIPLYARHAIPEVWIIDLEGGRTVRYREPQQGRYGHVDHPPVNAPLALRAGGRASVEISDVFGDREQARR